MKILEKLRAALGSPDMRPPELRAALSDLDVAELEVAVLNAERERAGLLLDGTEADLDRADNVLKDAVRLRDRAIAAKVELSKRLAEAETAEAAEALNAERTAVAAEAKTVETLLRDRFAKLQTEMVSILARLNDAEGAVDELNTRLLAAGRTDTILSIETRVFPAPEGEFAPVHSIAVSTDLKPLPTAPGYGKGQSLSAHFAPKVAGSLAGLN